MQATVIQGDGEAAGFVASVEEDLTEALGFRPFHGTLNVTGLADTSELPSRRIPYDDDHCDGVDLFECRLAGIRAAVIRPIVPGYPDEKTELIAPVRLRTLFGLADGDRLTVAETPWTPDGLRTDVASLDLFDAVVFDLDGTLIDLSVEWSVVHSEIETVLSPCLDRPLIEHDRIEIFDIARDNDCYDEIDAILETHEVEGARDATAKTLLEALPELDCPIGVCTANAERAAERALDRFGVLDHVDAVIARDSLAEDKPHPRPLSRCLRGIDIEPGNAVFIGDEQTDAETARRAGTSFLHPGQISVDGA